MEVDKLEGFVGVGAGRDEVDFRIDDLPFKLQGRANFTVSLFGKKRCIGQRDAGDEQ